MSSTLILSGIFIAAGGVILLALYLILLTYHLWEETGSWDGVDGEGNRITGPKAKCRVCGREKRFTWREWCVISGKIKT